MDEMTDLPVIEAETEEAEKTAEETKKMTEEAEAQAEDTTFSKAEEAVKKAGEAAKHVGEVTAKMAEDAAKKAGETAKKAGKAAKKAGEATGKALKKAKVKAVNAVDQNGDGKFDMEDVAQIAGVVSDATKKKFRLFGAFARKRAFEHDRKILKPIFEDTLTVTDFSLVGLLRICEPDDRREHSEACKDSVGYFTDSGSMKVINIYRNCVSRFGIRLLPDMRQDIYYADPCDSNTYIALDEYFSYLMMARINELQRVAQSLGAKHLEVIYKADDPEEGQTAVTVAEIEMSGHAPKEPLLHYLENDIGVQTLISMRMDEKELFRHQRNSIKLSNTSGLKIIDAGMIDDALKHLKCARNTAVSAEAAKEASAYLEYVIDFED